MTSTKLKVEEIDNMATEDTVGNITEDTGEDKDPSPLHQDTRKVTTERH